MKPQIFFNQGIHIDSVNTLRNMVLNTLSNYSDAEEIIINFSSPGGNLNAGFSLYNFLRSVPVKLHMHNIGNVESIAVIIYLAADIRSCAPHSRFKLHNLEWIFSECNLVHGTLNEFAEQLNFDRNRYIAIFNERTQSAQSPIDIVDCLGGNAKIFDIETAHAAGITTEASTVTIPTDVTTCRWDAKV